VAPAERWLRPLVELPMVSVVPVELAASAVA